MTRCHAREETGVRQGVREGAVRIVGESSKPIPQKVARDLGVKEGKRGNWLNLDRQARGYDRLVDRRYRCK